MRLGVVSKEKFEQAGGTDAELEAIDANGDGVVEGSEHAAARAAAPPIVELEAAAEKQKDMADEANKKLADMMLDMEGLSEYAAPTAEEGATDTA